MCNIELIKYLFVWPASLLGLVLQLKRLNVELKVWRFICQRMNIKNWNENIFIMPRYLEIVSGIKWYV